MFGIDSVTQLVSFGVVLAVGIITVLIQTCRNWGKPKTATKPVFSKGQVVKIQGLQKDPQVNGCIAQVVGTVKQKTGSRYSIFIPKFNKTAYVKDINIIHGSNIDEIDYVLWCLSLNDRCGLISRQKYLDEVDADKLPNLDIILDLNQYKNDYMNANKDGTNGCNNVYFAMKWILNKSIWAKQQRLITLKLNDYDESTNEMKQNIIGFIRDVKNKQQKIGAVIMDFELVGFQKKRKKDNLATEHAMTIIKCGMDNETCKFRVVQSFGDVFSLNEYLNSDHKLNTWLELDQVEDIINKIFHASLSTESRRPSAIETLAGIRNAFEIQPKKEYKQKELDASFGYAMEDDILMKKFMESSSILLQAMNEKFKELEVQE